MGMTSRVSSPKVLVLKSQNVIISWYLVPNSHSLLLFWYWSARRFFRHPARVISHPLSRDASSHRRSIFEGMRNSRLSRKGVSFAIPLARTLLQKFLKAERRAQIAITEGFDGDIPYDILGTYSNRSWGKTDEGYKPLFRL
jgi:hypothetical protein